MISKEELATLAAARAKMKKGEWTDNTIDDVIYYEANRDGIVALVNAADRLIEQAEEAGHKYVALIATQQKEIDVWTDRAQLAERERDDLRARILGASALAEKGLEVLGAREAWMNWSEVQDVTEGPYGTVYASRLPAMEDGGPIHRVLILPERP